MPGQTEARLMAFPRQTFILIGFGVLFVVLAMALAMTWLTGDEIHRWELLMVGGGLCLIGSLLWIRHKGRSPRCDGRELRREPAGRFGNRRYTFSLLSEVAEVKRATKRWRRFRGH